MYAPGPRLHSKILYIESRTMTMASIKYLALGDSYTVGEGVETAESFPCQAVKKLNETLTGTKDVPEITPLFFELPVVIAKTGWTTSELIDAINKADLKTTFAVVTLLIGVNNQYRGLAPEDYEREFEELASIVLGFVGNDPSRVIVLSIPDWSATPFAAGLDRDLISLAIDRFNVLNRQTASRKGFHYIDITTGSRDALHDPSLITKDQLHPSAIEYRKWSDKLVPIIAARLLSKPVNNGWSQ
jgi:lysophospholipase L1-like esterase